ncbi:MULTISPECIES: GerAB/ArcD/ProY family transporter [Aneurinibacillus]|uniref:Germination protein GerB n=1 Tax=Aneurinibacillus danicus TaxID=267746 RepID=A0A511V4A6_9BACL|nr:MULTISPECIES: GerAB/ArcD/ProY family transporter [Aneurinibacillus]GEN33760.1 germination protein GerB [Aneurinibacillus danicus]
MEKSRGVYGGGFSIDPVYLFFLVNTMQVGVGILRAPRVMAEDVGREGWIVAILAALLVQFVMVCIFYVLRKYQSLSLLEVGHILFGKTLNSFLSILIGVYYFLLGVLLLRDFIGILQDFIFTASSPVFLYLLFLYPCYLILRGGISLLTRFSVVVLLSTVWLMIFLIYPYLNFQWEFMLPLFQHEIKDYAKATKDIMLDYFGFEIVFFFYPLIAPKKKALLYASLGHWFTTLVYFLIIVGATGMYGSDMLKHQSYPTMDMFRLVQLPFIERVEIIGLSTWSMLILLSVTGFILICGQSIQHIRKGSFLSKPGTLTLLIFLTLLFIPDRFLDIDQVLLYLGVIWVYVLGVYTAAFVVLSYFRKGTKKT